MKYVDRVVDEVVLQLLDLIVKYSGCVDNIGLLN